MRTKYFNYIADKIASAKNKADCLSLDIGHHGIEGQIRELAVKECIEPFLTQSYQCGTGKVIDTMQRISDQIDLIIYHKKVAPPILINQDLGFFPVECVRYVFEVKSTLTATEIKDSIKKFNSVSSLISFPSTQQDGSFKGGSLPSTVLFAFSSDISGSEIERYINYDTGDSPQCTIICVLGKGYWFYDKKSKEWRGIETTGNTTPYIEFCAFITGFMNTLAKEETSLKPFLPGSYVNVGDVILKSIKDKTKK